MRTYEVTIFVRLKCDYDAVISLVGWNTEGDYFPNSLINYNIAYPRLIESLLRKVSRTILKLSLNEYSMAHNDIVSDNLLSLRYLLVLINDSRSKI